MPFDAGTVVGTIDTLTVVLSVNGSALQGALDKVAVTSDGISVLTLGITTLPPGSYFATVTVTQGAAGTLTLGSGLNAATLNMELV